MSGEGFKRVFDGTTCESIVNCPNVIITSKGDQGIVSGGSYDLKRLQLSVAASRV